MHSPGKWPSLFERRSQLPSMQQSRELPQQLWTRWRLQLPLLFWQRQQLQRRWELKRRQKLAATLVSCRFNCLIYPGSGGLAYTSS